MVHFSREKVGHLSGVAWLQFLDQLSNSHYFTEASETLLGDNLFKRPTQQKENATESLEELIKHSEQLIKQLNSKRLKEVQI